MIGAHNKNPSFAGRVQGLAIVSSRAAIAEVAQLNTANRLVFPAETDTFISTAQAIFLADQKKAETLLAQRALYPHMNVADNMSFSLKLARRPKAEIKERVAAAADILGLADLLGRVPRELSGGQRVAMGRAIVRDPKAFLFDEPLSTLDAKLRVKMRAEIKRSLTESAPRI